MARTTLDIDGPILRELRRLQKERGLSLGKLTSELLSRALDAERKPKLGKRRFSWKPRPMGVPRVDLRDKDALWALLDGDEVDTDQ